MELPKFSIYVEPGVFLCQSVPVSVMCLCYYAEPDVFLCQSVSVSVMCLCHYAEPGVRRRRPGAAHFTVADQYGTDVRVNEPPRLRDLAAGPSRTPNGGRDGQSAMCGYWLLATGCRGVF